MLLDAVRDVDGVTIIAGAARALDPPGRARVHPDPNLDLTGQSFIHRGNGYRITDE